MQLADRSAVSCTPFTRRQLIAAAAPLVVLGTMYPIFLALDAAFGEAAEGYLGWYLGLAVYWVLWGGIYAFRMIGTRRLGELIRPRRPTLTIVGLILFPVVMAGGVRLLPGMEYEKHSIAVWLLLISPTFGNSIFEEILWRGVYLEQFRDRFWMQAVWPTVWFALWHIIPISTHGGEVATMVIGPLFFGFYLAFLAKHTDGIWWPVVAHVLGGMVMVS